MGLIKQGILGGFRKKTGTVVGTQWRGLDVIRALPRSSGKARTQLQLEQQQKFGIVTAFLSNIDELINLGFKSDGTALPMNSAVAYHLKEAIVGTYPDFALDLEKIRYSAGKLEMPSLVTATAIPGGLIRFEWDGTTDEGKYVDPSDTMTVLAYNASKDKFVKKIAATTRGVGEFELQLPQSFDADTVHLYLSFSSVKKKISSNTQFIGTEVVGF